MKADDSIHSYYYNAGMGVFFTPEDENDLAKAIISLYQKSGAERDGLIDSAMKFLNENKTGVIHGKLITRLSNPSSTGERPTCHK